MNKYITKFSTVGESILDVDLVCQDWDILMIRGSFRHGTPNLHFTRGKLKREYRPSR